MAPVADIRLGDLLIARAARLSTRPTIYSRHKTLSGFKSIDCLLQLGAQGRLCRTSKIFLGERYQDARLVLMIWLASARVRAYFSKIRLSLPE
jgi:hypothetical protein